MNSWEIIITPEAAKDIRDIHDYIAKSLPAPDTAKKMVKRILQTIHSLENMPLRYSLYEKEPWCSRGLRKIGVGNFLVFYLPNESTNEVVIFHVFYGGRNIEQILSDNE